MTQPQSNDKMSSRDSALGAFVGLAIGDAFGSPVEFCRRYTFEAVTDMRAGGYFKLPVGAWTDDTAMAICRGESLIDHSYLDQKDLLDRFCLWAAEGLELFSKVNIVRIDGQFRLSLVLRQIGVFEIQSLRCTSSRKRAVPCSAGSRGNDRFRSLAHDSKGNVDLSELSVYPSEPA